MQRNDLIHSIAIGLLGLGVAGSAVAGGPFSGTIQSVWNAPVLSGNIIDAATGALSPQDYSTTAVCNLSGCPVALPGDPSTTVTWGDGDPAVWPINHSVVTFTGFNFASVAPGDKFALGQLTYTNGTSNIDSLIFGATLTLQAVGSSPSIDPLVIALKISTTSNSGTAAQNADFLDFGSTFGTVTPVTFNVYEGATATATLYGQIVGDPQMLAVDIELDPASVGSGFIGSGVPPVPEPATSGLFAIGLGALLTLRWRRRAG